MPLRRLLAATALLAVLAAPRLAAAGPAEDGKKALEGRRWSDAATLYRKALESSPGRRDAVIGFATATAEGQVAGWYEEADAALHKLLESRPDDREARLALGHLFIARVKDDHRWLADAQEQFKRVLSANPDDEEAVAGLARMYYAGADHKRGIDVLDAFLGKKPSGALALYWKGVILYDLALLAFQEAGRTIAPPVRERFAEALAAFEASTKADPKRYDAWIKVGYCAQYLASGDPSKKGVAEAAYGKALDLDGEDATALRGMATLYGSEPARWTEVVEALAKSKPDAPIVRYYHGYALHQAKRLDEAESELRAFVKSSRRPADGWFEIGSILEEKGDSAGALAAYRKSLEADPRHARWSRAVTALAQPIRDRMRDALGDAKKAVALVKEAEEVIVLAPKDVNLRNDVAFFAREAYGAAMGDRAQEGTPTAAARPLLDAAVKYYVQASDLIGEWNPEYEQTVAYRERHAYAQMLNDTGLMYQYYAPVRDLEKAEVYYRRAMEWSQNGYWDTYGNVVKILTAQGRWKEAYSFAMDCAEGIKGEDGSPNETRRAAARADAERFKAKIPE
jgi:tetratricopeptide (TPR) repeat protein